MARISLGTMSIVVTGLVLCYEDLGSEKEDCDAMIIKQRKKTVEGAIKESISSVTI